MDDHRLDHRYIVLKKSDVARLDPKAQMQLERLCAAVDFVREIRGAARLQAIVVERDWPEYEPTVKSILKRASGKSRMAGFREGVILSLLCGAIFYFAVTW